jgi:hypothetical protein
MNAGVGTAFTRDVLIAISASRRVVDLPVVANAGPDYRDLMNAGKALLRLAKFESASQSAERGRPLCAESEKLAGQCFCRLVGNRADDPNGDEGLARRDERRTSARPRT